MKNDAWKNIEPTIELGIFVGYIDTPHDYQVYLLPNMMRVVRRYVRFNEEKAMSCSLEREIQLHAIEEILAPKFEKPHIDMEQPHAEDLGVEKSTQVESSRDGRKCTRDANKLLHDAREIVGAPTS